jgi:uncharacterized protein YkwD
MHPRWTFLLVLALSIVASCAAAGSALANSCGFGRLQANQATPKKLRLATLCLLNRERRQHGLRRLVVNPRLRLAAHRHANDMVTRRYFAHVSSGGRRPSDRMRAAGYMGSAHHWLVGENLVWGAGAFSTPIDRVRALMHSPPHRENMLGPGFREVGIWVDRRAPVHAAYESGATYVLNFGAADR